MIPWWTSRLSLDPWASCTSSRPCAAGRASSRGASISRKAQGLRHPPLCALRFAVGSVHSRGDTRVDGVLTGAGASHLVCLAIPGPLLVRESSGLGLLPREMGLHPPDLCSPSQPHICCPFPKIRMLVRRQGALSQVCAPVDDEAAVAEDPSSTSQPLQCTNQGPQLSPLSCLALAPQWCRTACLGMAGNPHTPSCPPQLRNVCVG